MVKSRPRADDIRPRVVDHPLLVRAMEETRIAPDLIAADPRPACAGHEGGRPATLVDGRFTLQERIDSGGMAAVYRAHDHRLGRPVAVKLLHEHTGSDPVKVERFRREARAMAALEHPNIVAVLDSGEHLGTPYIALEYVAGETLKARIRRRARLPQSEAVGFAIEIGRALSCAHAHRLVHRDVKSANVLIDVDGRARLTDFGIARSLDDEPLTRTGEVLGSTSYISPEQALGRPATERSDIYSLGVCAYEMLVGETPFRAENPVAVALKHIGEPLPDVRERRPDVSAALSAAIRRSTAKDPADRYTAVDTMVHDLAAAGRTHRPLIGAGWTS